MTPDEVNRKLVEGIGHVQDECRRRAAHGVVAEAHLRFIGDMLTNLLTSVGQGTEAKAPDRLAEMLGPMPEWLAKRYGPRPTQEGPDQDRWDTREGMLFAFIRDQFTP
jgi:hypothetical protein